VGTSVRVLLERFFSKVENVDPELRAELLVCARELGKHYIPFSILTLFPWNTTRSL